MEEKNSTNEEQELQQETVENSKQKPIKKKWLTNTSQNVKAFWNEMPGVFTTFFHGFTKIIYGILAWIAGCDWKLIEDLPSAELNKKAAIGATMVFTIFIAGIAAGYMAVEFLGVSPLAAGLLWGGTMLTIDRAMIIFLDTKYASSNGADNLNKWGTRLTVTARIFIVLCMSYLTSTAVEMLIFRSEIESVIESKRNQEIDRISSRADSTRRLIEDERLEVIEMVNDKTMVHQKYVASLDQQINAVRRDIKQRRDELQLEVQGRIGSGKKGMGPAAKSIIENIRADSLQMIDLIDRRDSLIAHSVSLQDLNNTLKTAKKRENELDQRLQDVDLAEAKAIANVTKLVSDGFKDRYDALRAISGTSGVLVWAVYLMLMFIESMPILMKMFSGHGPYEKALAQQYQFHQIKVLGKMEEDILRDKIDRGESLLLKEKHANDIDESRVRESARMKEKKHELMNNVYSLDADLEQQRIDAEKLIFKKRAEQLNDKAKAVMDILKKVARSTSTKDLNNVDIDSRHKLDELRQKLFSSIDELFQS